METSNSYILLELVPRLPFDRKIKIANGDIIRLYATACAINIIGRRLHYAWKVCDKKKFSDGNRVALSLPNYYCGEWVTLTVDVENKKYNWLGRTVNAIKDLFSEDIEETSLETIDRHRASITFYPWCEPKINKIEWCDYYYQPIYKYRDLYVGDLGYIVIDIEGMNGKRINADIYINDVFITHCLPVFVSNNYACFYFMISPDWIKGLQPGSKATIGFYLTDDVLKKLDIYFSTKTLYIKERRNQLDFTPKMQPLVTGDLAVVENNFEKCKYTQINAKLSYDDKAEEEVTGIVFDENVNLYPENVEIIGCDDFSTHLTLDLINYTTKGCKLASEDKHKHTESALDPIFVSDKENNNEEKPDPAKKNAVIDISSGKIDLDVNYIYRKSRIPLLLIPLGRLVSQEHLLKLCTCRHAKELKIKMYPDIEWEFGFTYNTTIGKQKLLSHGFEVNDYFTDEFDPKCTIDIERSFSIYLEGKYNKEASSFKLSRNLSKTIKVTFEVFAIIKYLIVTAFHLEGTPISNDQEGAATIKNNSFEKRPHKALSVYICSPEIAMGIKWKLVQNTANRVGLELRLFANLDPLLTVGIIFDIIAFASDKNPWGAIVSKLRDVLEAHDQKLNLFLIATASSKVESEYVVTNRDETSKEDQDLFKFRAEGEFKLLLEIKCNGKFIGIKLEFQAEAYGKAGLFCDLYFGIDDEGIYYSIGYGNTSCLLGMKLKASIKDEAAGKKRGKKGVQIIKETEESSFVELNYKFEIIPEKTWGDDIVKDKNRKIKHYIKNK